MECKVCRSPNSTNMKYCPQCGHAIVTCNDNAITSTEEVENITRPIKERSEIKALAIRSFILGLIFPDYSENILLHKLIICIIAVAIAMVLFGIEKLFVRALSININYNKIHTAAYRGGIMIYIISYLQNGDGVGALTNGVIFGFIAAGICKFELYRSAASVGRNK